MNKYLFQALTNIALVIGIVFLAMNEHPFLAFILVLGIRVAATKEDEETNK